MMLAKSRIQESFSRAAVSYDEASDFQKGSGAKLIEKILSDGMRPEMILDIGMGTGATTNKLRSHMHSARIYGCDIAWGMAAFSKNKNRFFISQADAEALPYKAESFDLLFSNITHQWAGDIRKAFLEVKRVLKNRGRFYFSMLVDGSLKELYGALREVLNRDYSTGLLPNAEYIKLELRRPGLNIIWWEEAVVKRYYENCLGLLRIFKKIGANKILESNIFKMGQRGLFFKMADVYDKNFYENGKVFATYKIAMGCAEKI